MLICSRVVPFGTWKSKRNTVVPFGTWKSKRNIGFYENGGGGVLWR